MDSLAAGGPARPEKQGSLFRSTWTRAALVIAAVEAVLIVAGVVPRWVAVGVAMALLVTYFLYGRNVQHAPTRQGIWAVAVSQALVLLVPLALWIIGAAVVVLLAVVAVIVVFLLVRDR